MIAQKVAILEAALALDDSCAMNTVFADAGAHIAALHLPYITVLFARENAEWFCDGLRLQRIVL